MIRPALHTAGVATLLAVAVAPSASAHDWIVSTNPAVNSTVVNAPAAVRLTFDAPVLTKPAPPMVTVTGPDGRHYETGCASALGGDVTVPWQVGPAGKYTVTWRVVSSDGHPVGNTMSFTYKGKTGTNKGLTKGPDCDGSSSSGGHTIAIVAGSAGAIAVLGGVGALFYRRRHRIEHLDHDDE